MWDFDSLWEKARVFVCRAIDEEERDGDIFPLWCSFALELLCRASLAKVHPALLADPREGPDNILHACGYPISEPKSIPMKTVLSRCLRVCPGFTEREQKLCKALVDRRNEELHSGALAYDNVKHEKWLPEFYSICKILLDHQGKSLVDFLGPSEADVADEMIKAVVADMRAEAHRLVQEARKLFEALPVEQRLEAIKNSYVLRSPHVRSTDVKDIKCPACEGAALIGGKLTWMSPAKEEGDLFVRDYLYLPVLLKCYSCTLSLHGHEYLHGLGLGAQFKAGEELDPMEHFGIDPRQFGYIHEDDPDFAGRPELEYGND